MKHWVCLLAVLLSAGCSGGGSTQLPPTVALTAGPVSGVGTTPLSGTGVGTVTMPAAIARYSVVVTPTPNIGNDTVCVGTELTSTTFSVSCSLATFPQGGNILDADFSYTATAS